MARIRKTKKYSGKRIGSLVEEPVVTAVTYDRNQAKVSIVGVPDAPGVAARIFGALAKKNINVDMIIQSTARSGINDISFTIPRTNTKAAISVMGQVRQALGAKGVLKDSRIAKVSVVGVGMRSHSGVAARMFRALAKAKVNIQMISTSEIKVSCVVDERDVVQAVRVLHREFGLGAKR